MATLKITYPVITFNTITVELPDDQADQLLEGHYEDQVNFIYEQNEKQVLADLTDKKMIESALDIGYATIKRL